MVSKNVLRKLSNQELEEYLKEGNRFVPEAVQIAFEILEERGRIFSEQEKETVQQLIQNKKEEEEAKHTEEVEVWKDHITEDPKALKLYSRRTIFVSSVFFSPIPGSILLFLNLVKLKKYPASFLALAFGFLFFMFQKYVLLSHFDFGTTSRYSPEIGVIAVGALGLLVISVLATPKKLPYRAESYILPVILCAGTTVLMYFYFQEWFSFYPFQEPSIFSDNNKELFPAIHFYSSRLAREPTTCCGVTVTIGAREKYKNQKLPSCSQNDNVLFVEIASLSARNDLSLIISW
ncbi:hypothetical protein [Chryseobacterium sp. GVT01B]|uniref:hypothetical protein n=1 Tax=Chryseobacterium sp. GVT01B TaxID=2862675 RepID=UPI001CC1399A|nr:hypothetical protein [Chryseobacterium sp. GVT01B]